MRLIDADNIKGCAEYIKTNEKLDPYIMINDLAKLLDEQPTAYSVEKVVLELKKIEENCIDMNDWKGQSAIADAIEIVKQGSVSDDVCEWKLFNNALLGRPQWVYETTCGKYVGGEHTSKVFVYFPYCGKKIKVVEKNEQSI